jgi:adenylate cyclase
MISPTFLINARKVLGIFSIWVLLGVGVFFYEWAMLWQKGCLPNDRHFLTAFYAQLIATILGSLSGGLITVRFLAGWFRTKPYWQALGLMVGTYSALSLTIACISFSFLHSRLMALPFFHPAVRSAVFSSLTGFDFLRFYFLWLLIMGVTVIALLIKDKYGPGMFSAFLMGKYFRPKREERIFMFLDLRSSTVIAERLGEERYFNFLKEVFQFATPPILLTKGEIYQYAGDAVVISWSMEKGLRDANCLRCFFEVEKALFSKREYFRNRYDASPKFKAGLHCGFVMAGEIGLVKRDIAYTGDVLNTASRIQGKCNELGVNILTSKYLLDRLQLPPGEFQPKIMGEISLKGKKENMMLCTV